MSTAQTLQVPGYKIVQFLGSGARSTIWHIRNCRTQQAFALKRVVKRNDDDARFLDQAVNEYEVSTKLKHSAVRQIHEIHRIKRWLSLREIHLIMELCEGTTIQENRPKSVLETARIFTEVAKAVAHMNSKGFVHADLKPNNIIVAPDGTVKIIDLGQSCPIGTVKRRIQGTPDFIAPEQVHRRPLDARTDVFNFGAALYWALTGRAIPTVLPKKGSVTLMSEMTVVPPDQINHEANTPLSKLVMECIEARPAKRYQSMSEITSRMGLIMHTLNRKAQGSNSPGVA